MTTQKYIASIEALIAEHQQIQATNPPSSVQWQNASAEIHRLAELILTVQRVTDPAYIKAGRAITRAEKAIRKAVR